MVGGLYTGVYRATVLLHRTVPVASGYMYLLPSTFRTSFDYQCPLSPLCEAYLREKPLIMYSRFQNHIDFRPVVSQHILAFSNASYDFFRSAFVRPICLVCLCSHHI